MNQGTKKINPLISGAVLFLIFAMMFVPNVNGQNFKVGYVDPMIILDQMPEAKAVQQRIQNLYERKQNELAGMQQNLQTEMELYQQKVGVISEEARLSEEERLTQMDLEIRQLQSEVQQEIQERSAELMAPLFEQIQISVDKVSALHDLDLIMNITMGGYGILDRNILYVSPEHRTEYDVTSAVIEDLNL